MPPPAMRQRVELALSEVTLPSVCVLLATHNGSRWLDEQLTSIDAQRSVAVSVIASDDASKDDTPSRLNAWRQRIQLNCLPATGQAFGSANRNFLRLIRDASVGTAGYVALSDQDDIWLPDKLARAVECLCNMRADAYSSDAVAFWPNGRRRRIVKSAAQRPYDHIFESPGAGCTFVFTRQSFDTLQGWVTQDFDRLQDVKVHDWLIYAYARSRGWRWHIDDKAGILYRQHENNQIGANSGMSAALDRFCQIRNGTYRAHILGIAAAVGEESRAVRAVRDLRVRDRLWLLLNSGKCRRRSIERLMFGIATFLMPGKRLDRRAVVGDGSDRPSV